MARAIPERAPLGDRFSGFILEGERGQALALEAAAGATVVASGEFIARYGVRFLGKVHLSIVPGLVVLDYGDILTGEAAWDFLLHRSNLHPRAEVVGYRSDGKDDMVFIRSLDLALPVDVLVYADDQATLPLAQPTALIAADTTGIAPRLLEYLPCFISVQAWNEGLAP